MATVRSRRFFGPVVLAAGSTSILYTVPANRVAIIRSIWAYNPGGASSALSLTVNGATAADIVFRQLVPALGSIETPPEMILDPGDVLRGSAGTISAIHVIGFGSLLDGPPT